MVSQLIMIPKQVLFIAPLDLNAVAGTAIEKLQQIVKEQDCILQCVVFEKMLACFLPEIYYTLINGTHTLKKRGKDYEMVQGT